MAQFRALVVDDSQGMRRSVLAALGRMGVFSLDEAEDGVEALRKLTQGRFDVVLTDINMPVMDGLKLIRHIRQQHSGIARVPIVVMTTEAAQEDRERALRLGANAYLVKPVQAKEVVETVRELLHLPDGCGRNG